MVVLFILAVVAVVVAIDLLVIVAWRLTLDAGEPRTTPVALLAGAARLTAGMIFIVSRVNVFKLASGGEAVARMIGARRVEGATRDLLERRLLNVVEEM